MRPENYMVEQFADIRILKYKVPAFDRLSLREKLFIYYLSQATLSGRDILWDQNNRYNLRIRKVLERIIEYYTGDRDCQDFQELILYTKKVFFANGIHHHYSMDKFIPGFSFDYFKKVAETVGEEVEDLEKILFDPAYMNKRVVLDEGKDLLEVSANNYYQGVTQQEAEDFYCGKIKDCLEPESFGLNSTLIKKGGELYEDKWYIGGKYGKTIERIVYWLEKAKDFAADNQQKKVISLLIDYYRTGDLQIFDQYSIEWLKEDRAKVDFINGFIEVYGDPLALKGSWEAMVQIVDEEAGARTEILARDAAWFEENAPIDERFKKKEITGITARVMEVAMLGGDCYPATPIGINLPNSEWMREKYGSKSVTLENITYAYHMASLSSGVVEEFAFSTEEKERARSYGYISGNIHTDLHECLGHGSGKLLAGVTTDPLKNYYSTLEEARADLFALYYILDPRLQDSGITESPEVGKCEYDSYIRNGLLVQLTRIKPGDNLEESHMRNRQLIASWVFEQGRSANVIEKIFHEGKTFFVIRDYLALRALFGKLLGEVQRIKSEGDFEAAKNLIESYGTKVDKVLHQEVLQRYEKLNVPPYSGFINPSYELIEEEGEIKDVKISWPEDYLEQMLRYGREFSDF